MNTTFDDDIKALLEEALANDPGPLTAASIETASTVTRWDRTTERRQPRRTALVVATAGLAAASIAGLVLVTTTRQAETTVTEADANDVGFYVVPSSIPDGMELLQVSEYTEAEVLSHARAVFERADPPGRLEIDARPVTDENPYRPGYDQAIDVAGGQGSSASLGTTRPMGILVDFERDGFVFEVQGWGVPATERESLLASVVISGGNITLPPSSGFQPIANRALLTPVQGSSIGLTYGRFDGSGDRLTVFITRETPSSPWLGAGNSFGELTTRDGRRGIESPDGQLLWYPRDDVSVSAIVTDARLQFDVASSTAVFDSLVETDRGELEALAATIGQGRTADQTWDLVLDGHDLTIERISTGDSHLLCITTDRPTRGCTLARIPADLTSSRGTPSDLDGASVNVDGTWYVITAASATIPTATFAATADGTWIVQRPDPRADDLTLSDDFVINRPRL